MQHNNIYAVQHTAIFRINQCLIIIILLPIYRVKITRPLYWRHVAGQNIIIITINGDYNKLIQTRILYYCIYIRYCVPPAL